MSTDSRIDADLKALADSSARGLPTIDDTARELSRAQRNGGVMRTIKRPLFATAIGLCAVAVVLVLPVPYAHTVGYDLKVAGRDGRVATLHLKAKNAAQAAERADAIGKARGATVTVEPRTVRVWGSVYAMATEKLFHINVDLDGRSDAEIADDIKKQLDGAGWTPENVQVTRGGAESTVEIGASDGAGRQMKIVRKAAGGAEKHMDIEIGGIDDTREAGMTDAQLRDKILGQLKARGLDGDVIVEGGRVEIRASRTAVVDE